MLELWPKQSPFRLFKFYLSYPQKSLPIFPENSFCIPNLILNVDIPSISYGNTKNFFEQIISACEIRNITQSERNIFSM